MKTLNLSDLRTCALSYLARREYSRAELTQKIKQRFTQEADEAFFANLSQVLDDLTSAGYLSDQRTAESIITRQSKRFGTRRIVQTLREKGLAEADIQALTPDLRETEFATAQQVWQKKFTHLPKDNKEKAQQIRFMQYRGFSMSVIMRILQTNDLTKEDYDE